MTRAALLAMSLLSAIPAIAQDNNPFSGATGIRVMMTREVERTKKSNPRRAVPGIPKRKNDHG